MSYDPAEAPVASTARTRNTVERAGLLEREGPACCPSGLSTPMERDTANDLARLLKAVADPARLQLLALIRASENGEACACDLTGPLGLAQPTVSHHLKILTEAGLVTRERRGTWVWFRVVPERLGELAAVFA
jgi:ArsR family transcriptional regulator